MTRLYRIATNRCLDALRSAKRRPARKWDISTIDPPEPDTESGLNQRFSWRGDVPVQNERVDYVVSGADWLTLVEKFGLAPHLERRG